MGAQVGAPVVRPWGTGSPAACGLLDWREAVVAGAGDHRQSAPMIVACRVAIRRRCHPGPLPIAGPSVAGRDFETHRAVQVSQHLSTLLRARLGRRRAVPRNRRTTPSDDTGGLPCETGLTRQRNARDELITGPIVETGCCCRDQRSCILSRLRQMVGEFQPCDTIRGNRRLYQVVRVTTNMRPRGARRGGKYQWHQ